MLEELHKLEAFFSTKLTIEGVEKLAEAENKQDYKTAIVFNLLRVILGSTPAETASNENCRASLAKIQFIAGSIGAFGRMKIKEDKEEDSTQI